MNSKRNTKIRLIVISAIIMVGLAALGWRTSIGLSDQARASEPVYWPTEGWQESTPEEQGIDSEKLADGLLAMRAKNINIHSLLIIRNGYVVTDATFYPYDGQTVHDVASVTKSVMTTLIGIAADQGKLDLDDTMLSFFPNYTIANLDGRKKEITVRHLVSMSSGLDCTAEGDEKTLKEMVASPDYVQFALDRKAAWLPGEQFVYCSPAIHLLSPILQQASGMPALEFARQYLFEPLGIGNAMWEMDPQGYYDGWGDLSLNPRDMAKIGFLFLNHGQWDGKQIVSSQWVEAASQAQTEAPGDYVPYGYGWWMDTAVEGAYRADGRGGQYIFILPGWNMILVTTGSGFQMDEIAPYLLASFSDFEQPLPPNPQGVNRLTAAVASVIQPPAPSQVTPLPEIAQQISGKTYVFGPNPTQLISIAAEFDGSSEATIFAEGTDLPLASHLVGLDGVYRFSTGADGRPVAFRGAWINAQTFFLEYDGITNNDHSMFEFRYEGDQVEVTVQETAHAVGAQFVGHLQNP